MNTLIDPFHRACWLGGLVLSLAGCAGSPLPDFSFRRASTPSVAPLAPTDCDRLAADALDPDRVEGVAPVAWANLDAAAAKRACQADVGAHASHPRLLALLARAHQKAGEPVEALQRARESADQAYRYAFYLLGSYHEFAIGTPTSYALAEQWYRKAAEAGMPDAWNRIGILYADKYQPTDARQAIAAFRAAARAGHVSGMSNLGALLQDSNNERERREALVWLRQAGEAGDVNAQRMMGWHYWRQKDFAAALPWYRRAADAGDASALHTLGHYYVLGRGGVSTDVKTGLAYYERSARAGYLPGARDLASAYLKGSYLPRDERQGMTWLQSGKPTLSVRPSSGATAANVCNVSLPTDRISVSTLQAGGFQRGAQGWILDAQGLADQAGGPQKLLALSLGQLEKHQDWFAVMGPMAASLNTPALPRVQAVYQQAVETHEIEWAIRQAMECLLGLPVTPAERPRSLADIRAEQARQIAQREAEEERQARQASARSGFLNFLNALSGAMGSMATGRPSSGDGRCNECAVGRSSR